jgi:hypothetical protein
MKLKIGKISEIFKWQKLIFYLNFSPVDLGTNKIMVERTHLIINGQVQKGFMVEK